MRRPDHHHPEVDFRADDLLLSVDGSGESFARPRVVFSFGQAVETERKRARVIFPGAEGLFAGGFPRGARTFAPCGLRDQQESAQTQDQGFCSHLLFRALRSQKVPYAFSEKVEGKRRREDRQARKDYEMGKSPYALPARAAAPGSCPRGS